MRTPIWSTVLWPGGCWKGEISPQPRRTWTQLGIDILGEAAVTDTASPCAVKAKKTDPPISAGPCLLLTQCYKPSSLDSSSGGVQCLVAGCSSGGSANFQLARACRMPTVLRCVHSAKGWYNPGNLLRNSQIMFASRGRVGTRMLSH